MKILVTGGKGFLGKVLVRKLQEQNHFVLLTDFDLSQPQSLKDLLPLDADFVFHLAGKTGVRLSGEDPSAYYQANLDTIRNLLEYSRIKKTPLHYVSTYIYGNAQPLPTPETAPAQPNSPYAHSKWMGEELCRFYAHFFSLSITISRPFNIYGPHQSPSFFIPRIIDQLRAHEEIKPFNLHTKRDYVFVDDVADALIALMKKGKSGHSYNIGTGASFSCKEVIEELQTLMNVQKSILLDSLVQEDTLHTQASIEKIQSEIGWQPTHCLQEGLKKCVF